MVHIGLYPAKIERFTTRPELLQVIDECGVDLVLSGHDHIVARTYPKAKLPYPLPYSLLLFKNQQAFLWNSEK